MQRTKLFSGFHSSFWKKATALEVFKFALYIVFPLGASLIYANPKIMHEIIMNLNLVHYPEAGPPPPTLTDIKKYKEIIDKHNIELPDKK